MSNLTAKKILDRKVTVCSACETAACWLGIFMCDHCDLAGSKEIEVRDLHARPRGESPQYWFMSAGEGSIDHRALEEFREAIGRKA